MLKASEYKAAMRLKSAVEFPARRASGSLERVVRCPECGALNGHHHPRCSLLDGETAKRELLNYYEAWLAIYNERRRSVRRYREQVTLWQGKHELLRKENNALRRKLRRQTPNTQTNQRQASGVEKQTESESRRSLQ